ncbi:MAG: DUF6247 family protein [Pseudonocardiaceae bacterium]
MNSTAPTFAVDAAFDAALTAARQTLHLDQLRQVLRMWRRMALMTEQDPDGHRQMLVTAAEVRAPAAPGQAACPGANSPPSSVSDRPRPPAFSPDPPVSPTV